MKGKRKSNLYFLLGNTVTGTTTVANSLETDASDTTRFWHVHLRHTGEKALQGLVKHSLLKGARTCKLGFCEHCVLGKKTRVKFGTVVDHTKGILNYIHTDVWEPTRVASLGALVAQFNLEL
ncbi:uncharacterized mitochondrial protein AtMg00300-like [Cornus florida]|uniref:uncharacterized mitochondrial protein AtMg00300-like n=1 Tax=Cornus florida TaxID=4283 RepID=UPI00289C7E11|nr:uncharacterized mitochondrial protein AtMg00300-like [Cornus florida]